MLSKLAQIKYKFDRFLSSVCFAIIPILLIQLVVYVPPSIFASFIRENEEVLEILGFILVSICLFKTDQRPRPIKAMIIGILSMLLLGLYFIVTLGLEHRLFHILIIWWLCNAYSLVFLIHGQQQEPQEQDSLLSETLAQLEESDFDDLNDNSNKINGEKHEFNLNDFNGLTNLISFTVLFMLAGLFLLFSYSYEGSEPFYLGAIYSAIVMLPLSIIWLLIEFIKNRTQYLFHIFIWLAMCIFLIGLSSSGFVLLVNDKFAGNEQICIKGVITKREADRSVIADSYRLFVKTTQKEFDLYVDEAEYVKYSEQDAYSECWPKGALALLFK